MSTEHTKPPLWRDVRVLRVVGQILFVIAVFIFFQQIWLNLDYNYSQQGIDSSFDFLDSRAGFQISESVLDYGPNKAYRDAIVAGLANTVFLVAIPGIILATILGLIVGVGRLSTNWIVRKISQIYVEVLRNTPVLVIIIIFFVAGVLALPRVENGFKIPGLMHLSQRGMALTYPKPQAGFWPWVAILVAGFIVARLVRAWRVKQNEATGENTHPFLFFLGAFLLIAVAGAFATGGPVMVDVPQVNRFGYTGGMQGSGNLAGILFPLAFYTSAFIAEIIRGSIQAVAKGQKEAAEALGLRPMQQLRLVVLPQALRIAIPPINSQYLNLTKNSSLAIAVGFSDLASVMKTVINQSGRSFQAILILVATYLGLSLLISLLMNLFNRAVTAKGERRSG